MRFGYLLGAVLFVGGGTGLAGCGGDGGAAAEGDTAAGTEVAAAESGARGAPQPEFVFPDAEQAVPAAPPVVPSTAPPLPGDAPEEIQPAAGATPTPAAAGSGAPLDGKALFSKFNCYACHGTSGGGGMGPSLADGTWIYGGDDASIAKTIKEGRPRGMPPFGSAMSDEEVRALVDYVQSLGA